MNPETIVRYGDILAVPFFLLLIYYLINKKTLSVIEITLLIFGCIGFLFDLIFSINYLFK
jgi:hypothetical protein